MLLILNVHLANHKTKLATFKKMIKKLKISVKEKFQFKKTVVVFKILKPVVLFFEIFFSVSSFSQPGDSRFTHTFTITTNGDTMIFDGLTGNRVDFPSRTFDQFHEPIKKNKVIKNQILISYDSQRIGWSVKFSVHSNGEWMDIETNSYNLKIAFTPGSFYIPQEYDELFNSGLTISNLDMSCFSTDKDSIGIPELPMKYVYNEDKCAWNVVRVNDTSIVGLSSKSYGGSKVEFLKSFDNGLTWKSDSVTIPELMKVRMQSAELVVENDNSYFIIIRSGNTKLGFTSAILESKNRGVTWKNSSALTSLKITNLFFLDDGTGIAASVQPDRINFYVKEKGMKEWNFSGSENSILQPYQIMKNENAIFMIERKQIYENNQYYNRDTVIASFDYGATWTKHRVGERRSFDMKGKILTAKFGQYPHVFFDKPNPTYCSYNEQMNGLYAYQYKEGLQDLTIHIVLCSHCLFLSRDEGKSWKYIPTFAEGTKLYNANANYDLIFLNSEEILLVGYKSMSIGNIKGF